MASCKIHKNLHCLLAAAWAILFFLQPAAARIKLPAIFSDHMVLQQKTKARFWGWAYPGEEVTIQAGWSKKTAKTRADASGKWSILIQTPAAGGPFVIGIQGSNQIELRDVLVGEVWLCSGQSNMVFSLKSSENAKQEIEKAGIPAIRYFSVTRQYAAHGFDDSPGAVWELSTPKTAPSFSAVAYYFAKKIHGQLKIPVGIVYTAWGGTPAEAWTPEPVLRQDSILSRYLDRWKFIQDQVGKDSVAYHIALENWEKEQKTQDSNTAKKPQEPQTLYYFERPWREPGVLFNGMIRPIIPYTIKGVLWYQGESNVSYADEYFLLLSKMINSWRASGGTNDKPANFPFYIVQIASYGYKSLDAAARLREAEYEVARHVPNSGLAVTTDLGNMKNIHYTRKKEVGDRLALIALARDYGNKKTVYKGPECRKAYMEKDSVTVEFEPSSSRLFTDNGPVKGFEIGYRAAPGDTLRFVEASAKIEGDKIIVWNDHIKGPLVLRYAWLLAGEANLFNEDGLPAFPFRIKIESNK